MKHKIKEWLKRYLPAEIICFIFALLIAGIFFIITHNRAIAAFAGSLGENFIYYIFISSRDFFETKSKCNKRGIKYSIKHLGYNIRDLILEFGFSEFFDSFIIRPFFMYWMPILLSNFAVGIIAGKILADIIFYIPTITAYELRKKYLIGPTAKKVLVFGTFDILHKGHLSYFKQARKYGDYLIAVVARDKTVLKIKGRLPRNNEQQRVDKVKTEVDKAVLGFIHDRYKVIRLFKPDVICLGYDQIVSLEDLKKFNIPIKRLKAYKPYKYKSSKM
jgi:cytidyltransferase-like protein